VKYISFLFGLAIVVACFFGIWHVLPAPGTKIDAYTEHLIFAFMFVAVLGGFIMLPAIVGAAMKSLFGIVGQYIPIVGGRRAADPPAPPSSSGGPV
jgi:hypothetical protein